MRVRLLLCGEIDEGAGRSSSLGAKPPFQAVSSSPHSAPFDVHSDNIQAVRTSAARRRVHRTYSLCHDQGMFAGHVVVTKTNAQINGLRWAVHARPGRPDADYAPALCRRCGWLDDEPNYECPICGFRIRRRARPVQEEWDGSGTLHDHLHRQWMLDLKATLRIVEGDGETVPGRAALRVLECGGTGWGGARRWTEDDD
jgi:hypothetical protein